MFKRFFTYFKPHKKLFFIDFAAAITLSLCTLFYPMITRSIINVYVPSGDLRRILLWAGVLLGVFLLKAVMTYITNYLGHISGLQVQADMRRDIFGHLQKLSFTFFDNHKTGSIMSRIINDLFEVSELAHHGPEDVLVSVITIVGAFAMLCTINVPLTLIIFIFVPIFLWIPLSMRRRMTTVFARSRESVSEINAGVENSISGIRVAKSFVNSEFENKKFSHFNQMFKKARTAVYRTVARFTVSMELTTDLFSLITMLAGGLFCLYGKINFGDYAAYLLYIGMFSTPIRKLTGFVEQYQDGMSGLRRFIEIMDTEPELDAQGAVSLRVSKGEIEFENVSFNYEAGHSILNNINLRIESGKKVALVGPSGGGKTTLCHLIPRFYEVNSGRILIDGTDITAVTRSSLRHSIGLVSQDVFLFTGTIRDNIAYPFPAATDSDVIAAAKLAQVHDFITSLPEGYDTYVGERGVKLSGGQKQRIAIARIFLKNPPILILDEATSALDNQTELSVQASLDDLCVGRTTLVVAHRLSTIKNADMILVMTPNGIEEQGTHEELMKASSLYRDLYNAQFKSQE